jgi:hypothetical protein
MKTSQLLMACCLVALAGSTPALSQSTPEVVEIYGARNPERIPAWQVAQMTLRELNTVALSKDDPDYAADYGLIVNASKAFKAAQDRQRNRFAQGRARGILDQPLDIIKAEELEIQLEYRQQLLDVFEGLMRDVSAAARTSVEQRSAELVAGVHISIRREELDRHSKPR